VASVDLRPLTPKQRIDALRGYFNGVFSTPEGETVLDELRRIGRAGRSTFTIDDPGGRVSAHLEGRRWMLLYIEAMRDVSDDALARLLAPDERIK